MIKRNTKMDLTSGPIFSSVIKYAIPLYLMGLIQNFMVAADSAVLGNMADSYAVASVGATSVIINLLVASAIAFSEGVKLVMSRAVGSKNYDRCRKIVSTAMITAVFMGLVFAVLGSIFAGKILVFMNCPDECIDDAATYLSIYFCSVPIILVYNFGSAIVMVSGDSAKPMKYMLISGVINVCMNIILCLVLPNKVVGVAIATVIGNTVSAALVLRDLARLGDGYSLNIRHIEFNRKECLLMLRLGLPFAVNSAMFSLSNVQIQAELNSFGASAIAGNTAAGYIELALVTCIITAFSGAENAFVGQNLGAGNKDRVKKSLWTCFLTSLVTTLVMGAVALIFSDSILSIFVPGDMAAIELGVKRNKMLLSVYFLRVIANSANTMVAALGYGYFSTVNGIFAVLIYRIIYMTFIYPLNPGVTMLYMSYVTSWTLEALVISIAFVILYIRFLKDKYKKNF